MYVQKHNEALSLIGSQQPRTLLESWEYCIKHDNTNSIVTNDNTTQGQYDSWGQNTAGDTMSHYTDPTTQHYMTITENTCN